MIDGKAAAEWRHNWKVAVGASIAVGSGQVVWPYAMSSFVEPMEAAFGWSRAEIALALNGAIIAGIVAPFIGRLTDRQGARPVLLASMALLGLCYVALAHMNGSLALYYFLYTAMSVVGLGTGSLTITRAISSWFDASRGLALSTTRIGQALLGGILPFGLHVAIIRFGLEGGFYLMAGLALLVGLPISWLMINERRDAIAPHAPRSLAAAKQPFEGLRAVLANRRLMILCFGIGVLFVVLIGIQSQLQPILTGIGIAPATAASLRGLLALATLGGAVVAGILADRLWAPLLACLFTAGAVIGSLLLAIAGLPPAAAGLAIALIGVTQGALINLMPFLIARYFGMTSYSTFFGIAVLSMAVFSAVGGALYGGAFDAFGTYQPALLGGALIALISGLSYLLLGPYPESTPPASVAAGA